MRKLLAVFVTFFSMAFFTPSGYSAQYDIKEMTPQIQAALAGRQGRYADLQSLKSNGAVGENSSGYTEVLKPIGNAAAISSAENADRKIIYTAIVDQNGLGSDGQKQVQSVFAEVQRDKARSGDFIQQPGGQWIQKN